MTCEILLENGTPLLLEDGSSFLLEVCDEPIVQQHGGHFGEDDYRHYRKKLARLKEAADEFDRKKYIAEAAEVQSIAKQLDIELPEVAKVAEQVKAKEPIKFDFTAIQNEIREMVKRIDYLIGTREAYLAELDDEETLLLLL